MGLRLRGGAQGSTHGWKAYTAGTQNSTLASSASGLSLSTHGGRLAWMMQLGRRRVPVGVPENCARYRCEAAGPIFLPRGSQQSRPRQPSACLLCILLQPAALRYGDTAGSEWRAEG